MIGDQKYEVDGWLVEGVEGKAFRRNPESNVKLAHHLRAPVGDRYAVSESRGLKMFTLDHGIRKAL